jgi:hypothetical protein
MPVFEIEVNGKAYDIDAPKMPTREEAFGYVAKMEQAGAQPSTSSVLFHGPSTMSDYESNETPVKDALMGAAHPRTVGDMLSLLIPTGMKLAGKVAAEVGPELAGPASRAATMASDVTKSLIPGFKAYMAKRAPVISDIVRSVSDMRLRREMEQVIAKIEDPSNVSRALRAIGEKRGGRLVPGDQKAVLDLHAIIEEARQAVGATEVGGSIAGQSTARAVMMRPDVITTKQGPMVATMPDKWGVATIKPRSDADKVREMIQKAITK